VEERFLASLSFEPLELMRSTLALWIGPTDWTPGARRPDGWTLDGAADLPLAAFLLGACLCLWRSTTGSGRRADRADLACGAALLGSATLAKNEGLALAAITLAVLGASELLRRWWRSSGDDGRRASIAESFAALGLFALVVGPWLAIRGAIPSIDEDYPRAIAAILGLGEPPVGAGETNLTPTTLGGALARVPVVLGGFAYSFAHLLRWNLTWPLFLVVLLWWSVRRPLALARHPVLPLVAITLGAVVAYGAILVVTPWDLAALYGTTIPGRLVLHVAPLAILCTFSLAWTTEAERRGTPPTAE
ncbi:MAG: hypothetical protein AAFZ65_15305, partial [Planctomycetota bacterium]